MCVLVGFFPVNSEFMVDCVAQVTQTWQNRCFCKLTLRLICTGKRLSKTLVEAGVPQNRWLSGSSVQQSFDLVDCQSGVAGFLFCQSAPVAGHGGQISSMTIKPDRISWRSCSLLASSTAPKSVMHQIIVCSDMNG